MDVPEGRVHVDGLLLVVGDVAADQLDALVGLAQVVVLVLREVAVVVGGPEAAPVAPDARVGDGEGGHGAADESKARVGNRNLNRS